MTDYKQTTLLKKILLYRVKKDFTFERLRDQIFAKPATFLHQFNITPNILSVIGLLFVIVAALLLDYPVVAAILMILNLIFDGLDGVIARLYNLKSFAGSIVDTICDTLGSIIIVLGFSLFYNLSSAHTLFWVIAIIIYSLITAINSIKVQKRSKVLGFRNLINIGAILLLFLIGMDNINNDDAPIIITAYMQYISIALIILSIYLSVRLTILVQPNQ